MRADSVQFDDPSNGVLPSTFSLIDSGNGSLSLITTGEHQAM